MKLLANTIAPGFSGMSTGVKAVWSNTGFCGLRGLDFLASDFLAGGDAVDGDGGRISSPESSSPLPPGEDGCASSHSTAWPASPPDRSRAARAFLAENPISIIFSAPGGSGPPPPPPPPFLEVFLRSDEELRGSRFWRPFVPTSVVPLNDPSDTGCGDMLFDRDGMSAGLPGFGGLAEPGIAGGPDGAGGRPGTVPLPLPVGGGVREVPGGGGAPAGGFALEAPAAAAAARDEPEPEPEPEPVEPAEVAGLRTSTPDDGRGGLTAVGLDMPAPARRSLEMGAGRFGAGAGFVSSSPPLMKAPRA